MDGPNKSPNCFSSPAKLAPNPKSDSSPKKTELRFRSCSFREPRPLRKPKASPLRGAVEQGVTQVGQVSTSGSPFSGATKREAKRSHSESGPRLLPVSHVIRWPARDGQGKSGCGLLVDKLPLNEWFGLVVLVVKQGETPFTLYKGVQAAKPTARPIGGYLNRCTTQHLICGQYLRLWT